MECWPGAEPRLVSVNKAAAAFDSQRTSRTLSINQTEVCLEYFGAVTVLWSGVWFQIRIIRERDAPSLKGIPRMEHDSTRQEGEGFQTFVAGKLEGINNYLGANVTEKLDDILGKIVSQHTYLSENLPDLLKRIVQDQLNQTLTPGTQVSVSEAIAMERNLIGLDSVRSTWVQSNVVQCS